MSRSFRLCSSSPEAAGKGREGGCEGGMEEVWRHGMV